MLVNTGIFLLSSESALLSRSLRNNEDPDGRGLSGGLSRYRRLRFSAANEFQDRAFSGDAGRKFAWRYAESDNHWREKRTKQTRARKPSNRALAMRLQCAIGTIERQPVFAGTIEVSAPICLVHRRKPCISSDPCRVINLLRRQFVV